MPRQPDPGRRAALEAAVVDYVLNHGIADLSLRPLAEALGVSTFSLVYHFGSKEGLIAAVLAWIEEKQRVMTASWMNEPGSSSPAGILRRYWTEWCLPDELAPYHRLFYEIYGLALQQPARFPGFLEEGTSPWLPFIRTLAEQSGLEEADAEVVAWLMTSTVVGALFILLGTEDRETATRAVNAAADHIEELTARGSG